MMVGQADRHKLGLTKEGKYLELHMKERLLLSTLLKGTNGSPHLEMMAI